MCNISLNMAYYGTFGCVGHSRKNRRYGFEVVLGIAVACIVIFLKIFLS